MNILNKKIIIAGIIFLTPAFALADMEMGEQQNGEGMQMMQKPMMGSGMIDSEMKAKIEELRKSLEESIESLRESMTEDNLEEIKTKAEALRQEYLAKVDEFDIPEIKKMIEYRFQFFFQNNLVRNEEMKKLIQEKNNQFKEVNDEFNQKAKYTKEQFKDAKIEMKDKMNVVKEQFQAKKQDLKAKYKEQFAKKLAGKFDSFSADKIKTVITKIDSLIEKYNSNEKLTITQKEKFVAQLNAIKDLLQEKLDELENGINLDELLGD